MPSEVKRGLVRLAANYTRLLSNVVIGLASVQILLRETGNDGMALITTLGVTAGVANISEAIVRRSMIRELGSALHKNDAPHFLEVYNTATLLALAMSFVTLLIFAGIMGLLPLFNIEPYLLTAAFWLVGCKALESFCEVIFSPSFNMYIASERMMAHNLWVIIQRCARLAAALWLVYALSPGSSTAEALKIYAIVSAVMYIGVNIIAVLVMMLIVDRRTLPRPWLARRRALGNLVTVGKWNIAMILSINLHMRADQVITQIIFGLTYSLIFGLAMQLSSYVRMICVGMTDGLDAVATRMSTNKGSESVYGLLRHSTRLHAFVAVPSGIGMFLLAEPIVTLWVGADAENPAFVIRQATLVIQIMVLGNVAQAIGDGWIGILYGAGHIRRYARPIVLLSPLNPLVAIALAMNLPETIAHLGPPIAFSVVGFFLSGVVVPIIGARCLDLRTRDVLLPIVRPTLMAVLGSPVLILAITYVSDWNLLILALTCAAYALVVTLLSVAFVLDQHERSQLLRLVPPWVRTRSAGK